VTFLASTPYKVKLLITSLRTVYELDIKFHFPMAARQRKCIFCCCKKAGAQMKTRVKNKKLSNGQDDVTFAKHLLSLSNGVILIEFNNGRCPA
jgi:hypothetical protein